ncbi:MAG: hypothetical protein COU32_01290 [Candidatus Magasanikbacteria bacterium CG10_big_fil_rev_8_21_14_0_10_42_10]|uniref:Uncharacterized protein n=1 Tax=Candidatus Magasanikbacteria bacterium CG10_big_fil_rev_8_21_14_0_10_42_10 TaxID=1974649 RepID=A0A2H0TWP6_9BACT|nr:MAG: hypothetical protein COU32_01290 [Candidatus Magasanikbacteria bacterium CG10_big_fil_rev_8_21_14_0_10_42_10]
MLFRFEIMISGNSCCVNECIKTIEHFLALLKEKNLTVQTSTFRFHPPEGAVVLKLSAYGHQSYSESLATLRQALEAIPGQAPSMVGIYNRTYELSGSFDASREISGWTAKRQLIAFATLFKYFARPNREMAQMLDVGIGTIQRYRNSSPRKMHQSTLVHIIGRLQRLDPKPPKEIIDKFSILLPGDPDA